MRIVQTFVFDINYVIQIRTGLCAYKMQIIGTFDIEIASERSEWASERKSESEKRIL